MGKKKRQVDHTLLAGGDSSDSNEENQPKIAVSTCPHASKAIHLPGVKKVLKIDGLPQDCPDCLKANNNSTDDKITNGEEFSLMICLKCGHHGCGTGSKHAEQHSSNRQSDVHDLALNPLTWVVWCYKCGMEIPSNSSKKLLECVEYVRKNTSKEDKVETDMSLQSEVVDNHATVSYLMSPPRKNLPVLVTTPQVTTLGDGLPKVRGLSNLGNTCFFNAVLQCLGQTPFLLPTLEEMQEPGEKFQLPGGEVMIGEEKEILEPLEGELREWGPLTKTLADTLAEIQSGKSEVYSPRRLLFHVHTKCPQFAGYDQHDSHELLRQLLEMVRTEDLQRYQASILENLKLDKKSERDNITEEMKRKVKAYGRQANDLMLRPEQVFRGFLVSTLECQECHHTSDHIESFLDLSLPVMADKPVHVRRKSSSEDGDMSPLQPSKHQLKKERKAASRGRKGKHRKTEKGENTIDEEGRKSESDEQDEQDESDADVEDNVEGEPEAAQNQDIIESGYSSEKPGNGDSGCGSPASETNIHINRDSALASPVTHHQPLDLAIPDGALSKDAVAVSSPGSQLSMVCQPSPLTSSSETNLECRLSPAEREPFPAIGLERPASRFDYCQENAMEVSSDFQGNEEERERERLGGELAKMAVGDGGEESWSVTMAQRSRDVDNGECSLHSCLNQFTAKELMTGNNKVGCEACTKRTNQDREGKTVLTNASKQLLISSPPAVLILHLKRFQVVRCMFKKKCREVKFPTVFDLASYCSMKCKDSPTVKKDQTELLYSLYGVVEHSGTLYGGHYVAYVKVRAPLQPQDPRWAFLPRRGSEALAAQSSGASVGAVGGTPQPPPGKWYYVSDSRASEVKEESVLRSQAYLLFYERIW